jgi:para-nitrobenzyl esterase
MRSTSSPSPDAPRVATETGTVEGRLAGAVHAFLGIPYAAAPVGQRRWRPPEPAAPWQGIRQANAHGPSAWQPVAPEGFGPWTREFVVQDGVSEDCLYLNVWAPASSRGGACPVLVWIHGGAFCQGSGSVPIYDGRALAAQGVVVVSINYRLGVLGFLAHPDLAQEGPSSGYGNFGLQDQIAALQWIRANIAAFGGDPGAVTIAGQSAGALSVHMLVASPLAQGLFHRAIAQSGPPILVPIKTRAQAEADGLAFAAELNQAGVQALRAMSADDLTRTLSPGLRFMPMIDGVLLPDWPPQSSPDAADCPVPMIVGQTADENSGLDPDYGSDDPAALAVLLQRMHGQRAPQAAAAYLAAANGQTAAACRAASSDLWLAALWHWADHRVRTVRQPIFVYLFDHVPPGPDASRYGAFHTADVPYVLATLDAAPQRGYSDVDRAVSALASAYWLNFVKSGDPNGAGLPVWPELHPATPKLLRIAHEPATADMLSAMAWEAVHHLLRNPVAMTVLP